ncbi:hypothetical protein QZH41_006415 [Actinostola sp. cb2023]|nr:hypothetical protein QZH41_003351 [Actinostola sp. cb2023]KAK3732418.1 hypothetical protein QZH41_006415 [Actinostola sp. cb2023]
MKNLAAIVVLSLCCGLLVQTEKTNEEEIAKRLSIIRPPPPPPSNIYLPGIVINANKFNPRRRYCYCFRFKCNVPGMYNGFKGWLQNQNNKSGYIAINGKLYVIYRCDSKHYAKET